MVQADLGIKTRPYSKNAKAKGAVRAAQVVKHLPSKLKALSSDPSTKKKKKKSMQGTVRYTCYPACRRLRQEKHEFETSPSYIRRACLKKKKPKQQAPPKSM
jgi:hypothetical protein